MKIPVLFPSTLAAIAIAVGIATTAQAVTTQFTDLATFNANTTGIQTIDFEGLAAPGSYINYYSSGLTINSVNFSSAQVQTVYDPGYFPPLDFGSGAILVGINSITVTLPSGITAVGSDIMTYTPYGGSFGIILSTGESFSANTLSYPDRQFVGFISTTDIASIVFTTGASNAILDNFRFGTGSNNATSVPEPFTIIGTLIGGTAAVRMRKKLKSNSIL
jgi:hypothetical protein